MWVGSRLQGVPENLIFMSQQCTYRRTARGWRICALTLHIGTALLPRRAS